MEDPRYWVHHPVVGPHGAELACYRFLPVQQRTKQWQEENDDDAVGGGSPRRSSSGSAPPVVLLSAGCGNTVTVYTLAGENSLPHFLSAAGCEVWAFDLRGHGKSKPPPDEPAAWDLNSYVFQDAVVAIHHVLEETGAASVHYVGHSMGGMIGMALAAHPSTTHLIQSVCALGSSVYLRHSIWWWVLYFTPLYPIFQLGGGIDMSTHVRNTNCLLKLPFMPSCGVYDSMVASSANAGTERVNKLMEECFCYEPRGVMDDLAEGMQADGLVLRPHRAPLPRAPAAAAAAVPSSSSMGTPVGKAARPSGEGGGEVEMGSSPRVATPVLDAILGRSNSRGRGDVGAQGTDGRPVDTVNPPAAPPAAATAAAPAAAAGASGGVETDGESLFYLKDHIGSHAPRVLLVCATEDTIVPEVDVLSTYEAIVNNSDRDDDDDAATTGHADGPHSPAKGGGAKRVFSSRMFSVGTKAGTAKPYSHFDLVFGEDAAVDVFPEVADFIFNVEAERRGSR